MPRAPRQISASGIYHVLLRGVNRQRIFEDDDDYREFLSLLSLASKRFGITFYAYCLMSNHVHLLLASTDGPPSKAMASIATRYASWFNWKYRRTGHLFQDRFKSEPVEDDAYFLTVIRYIYQNPVKAGLCACATDYRWSSIHELSGSSSITSSEELGRIASPAKILAGETHEADCNALDGGIGRRRRYTDESAETLMDKVCGAHNASEFQNLTEKQQLAALGSLRGHAVPIRQIARITGLSKGAVESRLRKVQ